MTQEMVENVTPIQKHSFFFSSINEFCFRKVITRKLYSALGNESMALINKHLLGKLINPGTCTRYANLQGYQIMTAGAAKTRSRRK